MLRVKFLLLSAFILHQPLFVPIASAQETSTVGVRLKARSVAGQPGKLSQELLAVKLSGGTLVANTSDGTLILEGVTDEGEKRLEASSTMKALLKEIPKEETQKINKLRISYDREKKPTANDLKKLGLAVLEDYEKGAFMIVAPTTPIAGPLLSKLEAAGNLTFVRPVMKLRVIPTQKKRKPRAASKTTQIPNDPFLPELWGLTNINAPNAWKCLTGGTTVVAVIDTGVDYNHEDLSGTMWRNPGEIPGDGIDNDDNGHVDDIYGADFVNGDSDPFDDDSHGTHCAGTVSGIGNNGVGVVGVNWKTPIMALKWIDSDGFGDSTDAIKCIDYAVENGAQILSNSWWHPDDPELREAIVRARDAGVLFVAAAGNFSEDNDDPDTFTRFPSSYDVDNIISVAAINSSENLASFSSFGATTVDLGAPGVDVLSTVPGNGYEFFSGTSMATPHVAGAAALILNSSSLSNSSWSDVKTMLLKNARPLPSLLGKCVTGGTLDISFIESDGCESSPKKSCCPRVVSVSFEPGENQVTPSDDLIEEIQIQLKEAATVVVTASSSATAADVLLDQHLHGTAGDWNNAFRFVNLPADQWTGVTLTHSTVLPAGNHTISWIGFADDEVNFDGGSLTAIVVPIAADSRLPSGSFRTTPRPNRRTNMVPPRKQTVRRSGQSNSDQSNSDQTGKDRGFTINIEVNPTISGYPAPQSVTIPAVQVRQPRGKAVMRKQRLK